MVGGIFVSGDCFDIATDFRTGVDAAHFADGSVACAGDIEARQRRVGRGQKPAGGKRQDVSNCV